jgi:integrase
METKLTPATGRLVGGVPGIFRDNKGRFVILTTGLSVKTGKLSNKVRRTLPDGATEEEALKALATLKEQIKSGTAGVARGPKLKIPTLRAYAPSWAESQIASGQWSVDGGTAESVGWKLEEYVMPHLGDYLIDQITYADLQGWLVEMARRGFLPNTIKGAYGHLRCLVRAGRKTYGLPSLAEFPPPPRADTSRTPLTWDNFNTDEGAALTREQLGEFLSAAKQMSPNGWYPLCVLGFGSGARFSELAAVQVQDLDLARDVGVWLRRRHLISGTGESRPGIKWKPSGKVNMLDPETTRMLRPFVYGKGAEELLFSSDQGGSEFRSNNGLNDFIRAAATAAGIEIPGLSSKVFRRTYVTLSHLSVMADAMTQAQAGHADGKTTMVYFKPQLASQAEHAAKMDGVLHLVKGGAGG